MQDVEQAAQASGISRVEAAERIAAEVRRVVEERMLDAAAQQRRQSPPAT